MKLILLHGAGGCKESWQHQIEFFMEAEALDLPGPPQGEAYRTVDEYVEWLRDYIRGKGYKQVVIVGHSLGGGIALLYALKYPDEVLGIIPISSGARLRVHTMVLEALEKAIEDPDSFIAMEPPPNPMIDTELAEVMKKRRIENGPALILSYFRACDNFDILDQVRDIEVPTLAICGSEDIMTPPKYTHYMVEKMPDARAVIIPEGSHLVYVEKPEEVNQTISEFLQQL